MIMELKSYSCLKVKMKKRNILEWYVNAKNRARATLSVDHIFCIFTKNNSVPTLILETLNSVFSLMRKQQTPIMKYSFLN